MMVKKIIWLFIVILVISACSSNKNLTDNKDIVVKKHLNDGSSQQYYYYFIEDDVYCDNINVFVDLIKTIDSYPQDLIAQNIYSKKTKPQWPNWYAYTGEEEEDLFKSYNPFCRVSKELMNHVFNFYDTYHRLYFHEIILPTLCMKHNLKMLNYTKDPKLNKFFGYFGYVIHANKHLTKNNKSKKIIHPRYTEEFEQ